MFSDTGALSFQLDTYRWEDHLRRMQDMQQRTMDQETADLMIAQYNQLVHRYNALAAAAEKTGAAAELFQEQVRLKDKEIENLQQSLAASRAETEEIRDVWTKSSNHYQARAWAAEDALKQLRSQQE